jgi:hypothetical protein
VLVPADRDGRNHFMTSGVGLYRGCSHVARRSNAKARQPLAFDSADRPR